LLFYIVIFVSFFTKHIKITSKRCLNCFLFDFTSSHLQLRVNLVVFSWEWIYSF
jgi:hypothetical protein